MSISQLTVYQMGLLCDTAAAQFPMCVLPLPCPLDSARRTSELVLHLAEAWVLIRLGLFEDVTAEFSLKDNESKREFVVFGLTDAGRMMFNDTYANVQKVN